MPETARPTPRVLVGAVTPVKSRSIEELGRIATEEVRTAGFTLVRSVVVNGESEFIQQLVSNVSNDNEADAIILVGGTGFGPKDAACEAIESLVERRIEGFAEAYRHMLRGDFPEGYRQMAQETQHVGTHAWLVRATAGVYNQCVVFALTGRPQDVRNAVQMLIVPALSDAVELATGRMRAVQIRA